jgi:predicted nucleic acid-binding protein
VIVVSDAGPLLYLGAVGRLPLLQRLFQRVVVPRSVWDEVVTAGAGRAGAGAVAEATWLVVLDVPATSVPPDARRHLDPGEGDGIQIALHIHADLFLCDDRAGRVVAEDCGLPVIGTLGVLVRARREGLIEAVGPEIQAILAMGFRATPALVARVLEQVGE